MESPNALPWIQLNKIRNYPFTDNSTLAFSGGFLSQELIVDARIYIQGNYQQTLPPYISKLIKNLAKSKNNLKSKSKNNPQ